VDKQTYELLATQKPITLGPQMMHGNGSLKYMQLLLGYFFVV
jgi:hypothetical protein